MATGKLFRAKFFDKSGVYIQDLDVSLNSFRKIINGGLGDLGLQVPLRFDEAYQNAALTIFNRVQIYTGEFLLYSGFVAGITPRIAGGKEDVTVTCRGHTARFPFLPLKNSTTTTLYTDSTNGLKTASGAQSTTLDKILTAIVDRYQAEAVLPIINYASGSIVASSNSLTHIFVTKTIQDAIDKVMDNAPAGWYWRVGADNVFRFLNKSSTADFTLNFNTQITEIEDSQLIDGMINRSYFAYDGSPPATAKVTSDTTSSGKYGDWWNFKTDGRYTVAANVTNVSTQLIDTKKNPVRRLAITVPELSADQSSGYEIELIEPGQTCKIVNLPEATSGVLPSLFQVAAVTYQPGQAKLELENELDDIAREQAKKERQDQAVELDTAPTTYS